MTIETISIQKNNEEALWIGYSTAFRHLSGHEDAVVTGIDSGAPTDPNFTMTAMIDGAPRSETVSKRWFRDFVIENQP